MMRKRLLLGGFWALLSRVAGIALSLAINSIFARLLDPSDMGVYFLAMSVITFASLIGQMGMPQVVVRVVAESLSHGWQGRAGQTIQKSVVLSLVLGSMVALVFYVGAGNFLALSVFHSEQFRSIIGYISMALLVMTVQGVVTEAFRGMHDIREASLIGSVLVQFMTASLLFLYLSKNSHATIDQMMALIVVSYAIAFFLSGLWLWKRTAGLHGAGEIHYKELLIIGWPFCVLQLAILISSQADLWIVGASFSKDETAIYGAIQKILLLQTMTHGLVVAVAQSSVAELHAKKDSPKLQRMIQGIAFVAAVPSGLILLSFVLLGKEILGLAFGAFYTAGLLPLLLLGAGNFLGQLLGPGGMVLMMTGKQKLAMVTVVLTSLVSSLMVVFLVKPFGLNGVAFAWGLGSFISSAAMWVLVRRYLGIWTHAWFLPEILSWRLNRKE